MPCSVEVRILGALALVVLASVVAVKLACAREDSPAAYSHWPDTPVKVVRLEALPGTCILREARRQFPDQPLLLDLRGASHEQDLVALQSALFAGDNRYTPQEWKNVKAQYAKLPYFKDRSFDAEEVSHYTMRRMREQPWTQKRAQFEFISRQQIKDAGLWSSLATPLDLSHPDHYLFKLWYNPQGYTTYLHDDNCENIVYQVSGRKRWLLVSPRHMKACQREPRPNNNNNYHYGVKDPAKTPVPGVTVTEVIMEPGQALYIPKRYLHLVESLEDNVMLSCLFRPTFWQETAPKPPEE